MLRALSVLLLFCWCLPVSAAESVPNIVFILADDLGWKDLGCYGGTLAETPHLDQLAKQGLRFTNAYSPAPICSASRASILTGRTPARLHFEFVTKPAGVKPPARQLQPPEYTRELPLKEVTIAEMLQQANYQTGFFGKWHVCEHYQHYLGWSPTHGPKQQGFQSAKETFGSHPYAKKFDWKPGDFKEGEYPPDAVTEHAIDFLKEKREQPFFLYLSYFHVHTPVRAPTDWLVKKYQKRAAVDTGDEILRTHYGAFIETLDAYVGQVLTALDQQGLRESTLVVFTSDNGGTPEYADNAPLRGSKWNLYEAGIRVPLLVRWPQHVQAGSVCTKPVSGIDLFPTFCDVARVDCSDLTLDGESLLPLFHGATAAWPERALTWHFPYYHPEKGYKKAKETIGVNDFTVSKTRPVSAIRVGDSKLLQFYEVGKRELYDLSNDPGEQHDLSNSQPERTAQLGTQLKQMLLDMDARYATDPFTDQPKTN
ncbi:sulfatase [Gimesia maris]|mgnify:CR=1 FL=1|uniref:sulfatase n=1 Tax=Gimesia maris TaxID=122 RepID=UPI00241D4A14|nr:sulfatase [Gimesia maris]|tara:strand:+ start:63277 stop:64722 length:1446 start_codon:yes stop_codon:yes gene_type:complete